MARALVRFLVAFAAGGLAVLAPASAQVSSNAVPQQQVVLSPMDAAEDSQRLERALAGLTPQRRGVVDAYVISAGFYDDHVFDSEAKGAAAILSDRFGAAGRTVTLSMGETASSLPDVPLASPSNLSVTLGRLAKVMDPDEDVLVLFLTSHGDAQGSVVVQRQRSVTSSIRPTALRAWLDNTGVKRRVVIVSACYSGGFASALAAPQTIVLTAAAVDRSSFGCQAENEWTYFGDAFFNQSLRRGRGLIEAFEEAKAIISMKEASENLKPSKPMSSVGADVAAILGAVRKPAPR